MDVFGRNRNGQAAVDGWTIEVYSDFSGNVYFDSRFPGGKRPPGYGFRKHDTMPDRL